MKKTLTVIIFMLYATAYGQYEEQQSYSFPPSPSISQTISGKIPKFFFPELEKILTNKITANFDNVDVKYVVNFIKPQIPLNVIVSPQIPSKNISISVKDANIYDLLVNIIKQSDVYLIFDGKNLMLLPYVEYEKVLKESFISLKVYDIRFINTKDIKEIIKTQLTPLGDVILDSGNNIIIVKDVIMNFERIENFLRNIGVSPKVVMIKVEIIQIDRDNSLDYGFDLTLDNVIKSVTSLSFKSAPVNISSTGLFSISFSSPVDNGGIISGIIKALSTYGDVKLLSSPRVVCKNGEKAKILIGDKIPYIKSVIESQTAGTGLTTSQIDFIEAGIKLEVEPRITMSGEVSINVKVGISSYRFIDLTSQLKAPQINTTEGEINAVVKDGIPLVIGGLEKVSESLKKSGIPFLMDIPVLGDILFSNISKTTLKSTILIILTPEIVDYSVAKNISIDKEGKIKDQ
ncbi:MAG: type II secretion system protein GspD [Brevinematia bacterium]